MVNADKLLQKYVGRQVRADRKASDPPHEPAKSEAAGILLSFDAGSLVLRTNSGIQILSRSELTGVTLAGTGTDLITKPTLLWKVATARGGPQVAQIAYQTDNLTWRADYNVTINKDDTAADLAAWVSILNESGAPFPDAHIKLVAGDVQRLQPPEDRASQSIFAGSNYTNDRPAGFKEKSFFEYHLYTLGRTTSLANNSTKQIELFPSKAGVPVNKKFVYYGLPEPLRYNLSPDPGIDGNLGLQCNKKVDIYLELSNSEKNGLGIPVPAGRIRVYKRDEADQNAEFIGEDVIQHTPRDENVLLKLGSAFDLVGERKQTNFTVNENGHEMTESVEIKLRNHKTVAVDVIIKENLFRWTNWEITASSDKWDKQDYRTIHIPIHVEKDAEKTVSYTVRYTW